MWKKIILRSFYIFLSFAGLVSVWADDFHINHVGYSLYGPKFAVAEGNSISSFELVDARNGTTVYQGTPSAGEVVNDWFADKTYYRLDFSEFSTSGTYYLKADGISGQSHNFIIEDAPLFTETLPLALDFFTKSRADTFNISGGVDKSIWNADAAAPFFGNSNKGAQDVRGGWYDASGDLSKYLSHLNYGNYTMPQQIPMSAYAMADIAERISGPLQAMDLYKSMQAEALWGADYLVRVLDPDGYFYINVFDGWSGYSTDREICAFEGSSGIKTNEWQAGFREGAGVSIAALARMSQWNTHGDTSNIAYLAAAERAWSHLTANNFANAKAYADDGQLNFLDNYTILLAAVELYAATAKADYLTEARSQVQAIHAALSPAGYFIADGAQRPFYHAADAGLPIIALARYMDVDQDASTVELARSTIATHLEYLLNVTDSVANPFEYARQHILTGGTVRSNFFIPHDNETEYWWQGESARQASLATAALIGGRKISSPTSSWLGVADQYHDYAMAQLNWIMGQNPFDICMMAGVGRNNPPSYKQASSTSMHSHLDGGISNGITGSHEADDGSGIVWKPYDDWNNWRWIEQWIPHDHWYLFAVSATAQVQSPTSNKPQSFRAINSFKVYRAQDHVQLSLKHKASKPTSWSIVNLQGRVLAHGIVQSGEREVHIPLSAQGLGVVQVQGLPSQTLILGL